MPILRTFPRASTASRALLIGASDAPVILGLSPWQTPFGWWASRQLGGDEVGNRAAVQRGKRFERVVLDWTAEEVGANEVEPGIGIDEPALLGPEPFVASRPDGALLIDGAWEGAEVKTSRLVSMWGDEPDGVPLYYLAQVQWQLACMPGVEAVRIGAWLPVQERLLTYRIERDDALIARMINDVGEWFLRHVLAGETPAIDGSSIGARYLHHKHGRGSGRLRVATADERRLVLDLAAARLATKAAKAAEDALANQLRAAIGDDDGVTFDGGKATWREQAGAMVVDTARLREQFPAAASLCMERGEPTRVLRLSGAAMKGAIDG